MSTNVHHFKRWVSSPKDISVNITPTDTTTTNVGALEFKLSDIVNAGEFTALYDRYKITRVQLRVHLISNPDAALITGSDVTSVAWNANNVFPRLWYCPDYDDSAGESIEVFKQRAKAKHFILKPNKDYKFWIKPATLVQAYESAITTTYEPTWDKWVDMANPNCKYYGWRYALDTDGAAIVNTTYPYKLRINMCYWFTCKDTK